MSDRVDLWAGLLAAGLALPAFAAEDVESEIARLTTHLSAPVHIAGRSGQEWTLAERMEFYRTPGVSIAWIRDDRVAWARGFGETLAGGGHAVGPATLFQAASISKVVAAMVALDLVEERRLTLDGDLSGLLGAWVLPREPGFVGVPITLRQLLSHQAGVSVAGFAGYARDAPLPSLLQILSGTPPATNQPIRVVSEPGAKAKYSGGGYVVLQQLLESVSGEPFDRLARERVLRPAGLLASDYFARGGPETGAQGVAMAHDADGRPYPGGFLNYPQLAPAGLWSTAADLARLAIEVQSSWAGRSRSVLDPSTTREMLRPQAGRWGLGWELPGGGEPARSLFANGSNGGYKAFLYARLDRSEGIAILTNSDNGGDLAGEILAGAARLYGWPELAPEEREVVALAASELAGYAGRYDFHGVVNGTLVVTVVGDHLQLEVPGLAAASEFFPASRERFFDRAGNSATFRLDEEGRPIEATIGDIVGIRTSRTAPDP